MYFQIKTSAVLIVLAVLDLCLSVPSLAEQIKNNANSLDSNNNKFTTNRKYFLMNSNDDQYIDGQLNNQHSVKNDVDNQYSDHRNFLLTNTLSDGEIERRIHFNGITAKETLISNHRGSLSLWQMSYRDTFLQMIYKFDGEILDCDFLTGQKYNEEFVQNFYTEIQQMMKYHKITGFTDDLYHMPKFRHRTRHNIPEINLSMDSDSEMIGAGNLTYQPLFNQNDIPKDLLRVINFDRMKSECDAYHQNVMRHVHDLESESIDVIQNATEHLTRKKRALSDWLIAPNTKWCGRGQTAEKYSQLGGASKADKCCRRHDHCKFNIYAMTTKWRLFNYRPFTISHCSCDIRRRRDLTNFLRVPGTKWCGKGYSAKKYAELGGRSKADRCCRQHDKSCPFWIMGFETKYGLFNWRINTLMHCKCDDRFRTCLKMADSSDATMVGKLFFNIVQTKCFVLKPEKYCKSHSWWGACESEGVRKRAHLRNNKKF